MSNSPFDAVVFDLDGTILDTLPDLVELTNAVMRAGGFPTHTTEEVLTYVGGGIDVLLQRALPHGTSPEDIAACRKLWVELYPQYGYELTKPYPGMDAALAQMKAAGLKLGVLSNKFDGAAREVVETYFPQTFDLVRGESTITPRKPDPTGLLAMIADLGTIPKRTAYVGDSGATDMAVARFAGAYAIGVTWGYQPAETLIEHGARVLVDSPAQLVELVM